VAGLHAGAIRRRVKELAYSVVERWKTEKIADNKLPKSKEAAIQIGVSKIRHEMG
jgi:hypothetical protein